MTSYYSAVQHDVFEMDAIEQPFEMDGDYGFYEDLDSDDEAVGHASLSPLSSNDEDSTASLPVCGSRIDDADADSLFTSPPILNQFMVDTIAEDGLPWSMQDNQWERLFSSSRDGSSFGTFMRRVRGHGQTIIVAKTSDGRIFGGFATDVWSGRKQPADSQDDGSHAFLFAVDQPAAKTKDVNAPTTHTFIPGLEELSSSPTSALDFDFYQLSVNPQKPQREKAHVEFFKPSQKQDANAGLKQACQVGNKFISMTDNSGDLSLVIESSFSRGVARTQEGRVEFTVAEFEVYGFSED